MYKLDMPVTIWCIHLHMCVSLYIMYFYGNHHDNQAGPRNVLIASTAMPVLDKKKQNSVSHRGQGTWRGQRKITI